MKFKFPDPTNLLILLTILGTSYFTASVISPFLHYYYQHIGFLTSFEFFKSYSSYPGGIADYLSVYISQFFTFNSTGSFLIVGIASMQAFFAIDILRRLYGRHKFRYSIFAAILLFGILVLCDYRYPYYASIRLFLAYFFIWGFSIINAKSARLGALIWPLLASFLFYLASGAALFVFGLSTAIIFLITNRQRIWLTAIPAFLFLAGLIPYIGYKFIFQMTFRNIFGITMVKPPAQLSYVEGFPIYIYYSLLPGMLLLLLIALQFRKSAGVTESINTSKKGGKVVPKVRFYEKVPFVVSIQVILFGLMGYFLVGRFQDSFKKQIINIDYLAENGKWADVLKSAEALDSYDYRVNFHVNRAYAHLGYLPDRLFAYPQRLGSYGLFFDPSEMAGSSDMPTSDLYFDLGYMAESQRYAFEAETLLPNSPRILKRLVMINLVNRKYKLAGEFLNVLDKNMLCHDWVRKYQIYVSDTTLAANDPLIAEKRRFSPTKYMVNVGTLEGLKLLIETNRDNRMAYEYLLTYLILDSRLSEFVDYLKYYTHYHYKRLPTSWEEALSLFILKTRSFPAFYTEETISKDCMQRITNFNKVMKSYNNDLPSAQSAMQRDFGETYWYYTLYLSPKVTNILQTKTAVR